MVEVNAGVLAVRELFGHGPTHPGGLLQPVPTEPVGEDEVLNWLGGTDDGVLVEGVVGVVAGPGVLDLQAVEAGYPLD